MSSARYLIRFDDIAPGMNWTVWERIEAILNRYAIKPIVAVVPDNRDEMLDVCESRSEFWQCVRSWQREQWCIGLHGYQHRYTTDDPGLLGINPCSEFAGLPESVQREKLVRAIEIFEQHGVAPDCWVAPAHSFDRTTLKILADLGIGLVSDGFYYRIVKKFGVVWIPQQIWQFRPMPAGVWTVCFHINAFSEADISAFEINIERFARQITSVKEVLDGVMLSEPGVFDEGFSAVWRVMVKTKRKFKAHKA